MRQRTIPVEAGHASDEDSPGNRHKAGGGSLSTARALDDDSDGDGALPPQPATARGHDWAAIVFGCLGVVSRFAFLNWPPQVVFDEYHFGKCVSGYIKGAYFFDIHTPLAKILLALAARLGGYDGSQPFQSIGEPFHAHVPIFALRALPAAFGAAIVPLAWRLGLALGCSRSAAALAATMVLLDGSLLVESRILVTDALLFFFELAQVRARTRVRTPESGDANDPTHHQWVPPLANAAPVTRASSRAAPLRARSARLAARLASIPVESRRHGRLDR